MTPTEQVRHTPHPSQASTSRSSRCCLSSVVPRDLVSTPTSPSRCWLCFVCLNASTHSAEVLLRREKRQYVGTQLPKRLIWIVSGQVLDINRQLRSPDLSSRGSLEPLKVLGTKTILLLHCLTKYASRPKLLQCFGDVNKLHASEFWSRVNDPLHRH